MPTVPRSIHQIWLQGDALPEPLAGYVAHVIEVCKAGGWTHTLWTAKDLSALTKVSQAAFGTLAPKCCHLSQQSNVLRYLILQDLGGLYLDTDVDLRVLPDELMGAWIPATRTLLRVGSFALACSAQDPWAKRIVALCAQANLGISGSAGSKLVAASRAPDVNVWPRGTWEDWNGHLAKLGIHHWLGHQMGHFVKKATP